MCVYNKYVSRALQWRIRENVTGGHHGINRVSLISYCRMFCVFMLSDFGGVCWKCRVIDSVFCFIFGIFFVILKLSQIGLECLCSSLVRHCSRSSSVLAVCVLYCANMRSVCTIYYLYRWCTLFFSFERADSAIICSDSGSKACRAQHFAFKISQRSRDFFFLLTLNCARVFVLSNRMNMNNVKKVIIQNIEKFLNYFALFNEIKEFPIERFNYASGKCAARLQNQSVDGWRFNRRLLLHI